LRLLLDTHFLIWMAGAPEKLSTSALEFVEDTSNSLFFSTASIWEAAIKYSLKRPDFQIEPAELRQGFLDRGHAEVGISSQHVIAVAELDHHHRDPFDRLLIAQAKCEEITLLTVDRIIAKYGQFIIKV